MLSCERCGTSFSETRGRKLASCPRCRVRGVSAPLAAMPDDKPALALGRAEADASEMEQSLVVGDSGLHGDPRDLPLEEDRDPQPGRRP